MGYAQAEHGAWCNLRTYTVICRHCGRPVFYLKCDHVELFFDDAGGPWSEHRCLESQLAKHPYQLLPRTAMSVATDFALR